MFRKQKKVLILKKGGFLNLQEMISDKIVKIVLKLKIQSFN